MPSISLLLTSPLHVAADGDVDCQLSDWSEWTACTLTCGTGTRSHKRTVTTDRQNNGKPCGDLVAVANCAETPCTINCVLSAWSSWSVCSATCGGGTKQRSRTVLQSPGSDPAVCPDLQDVQPCNTVECAQDCVVSPWADWSDCAVTCGPGSQTRVRTVTTAQQGSGTPCAVLQEPRNCNAKSCPGAPVDCVLSLWSKWSTCSKTCGSGQMTRTRTVKTPPSPTGQQCDVLLQSNNCGIMECNQDCTVAAWGEWGACQPHPTDPATQPCTATRSRSVTTPQRAAGKACPDLTGETNCSQCSSSLPGGIPQWLLKVLVLAILICLALCLYLFYLHKHADEPKKSERKRAVKLEMNGDDKEEEPLLDTSHPVVAKLNGLQPGAVVSFASVPVVGPMQQIQMPTMARLPAQPTISSPQYAYAPVMTG